MKERDNNEREKGDTYNHKKENHVGMMIRKQIKIGKNKRIGDEEKGKKRKNINWMKFNIIIRKEELINYYKLYKRTTEK